MKRVLFWATAMLTLVMIVAACSSPAATQPADHVHPEVPAEYAGKTNPLANDPTAVEAGSQLYTTNCATCHGTEGMGDGPAAAALNPPPRPLATEMDQIGDDYLYWRIAEGGAMAPFHSVMPAWKMIINEDQIWQIITFLRTLS